METEKWSSVRSLSWQGWRVGGRWGHIGTMVDGNGYSSVRMFYAQNLTINRIINHGT